MRQVTIINNFVDGSKFYLVKFNETNGSDMGKILRGEELLKLDLSENEIYRSVEYKNNNTLFVYDLKTNIDGGVKNPLSLLKSNLEEANIIESVYPRVFTWCFDGLSIKAYAIIPSGINYAHSTISRYGGTHMFINILRQHLSNIGRMVKGISPDYSFLKSRVDIEEDELCVGSVNKRTNLNSIMISLDDSYIDIINKSRKFDSNNYALNMLDMKYWAREINPDFIVDSRVAKLENTLPLDKAYVMYPSPINKIMALFYKGETNRDIIARFLLSIHDHADAKHIYYSIFGDDELSEVRKVGANCWNYSVNNHKKYGCPTNEELKEFVTDDYTLSHPLEDIQNYFNTLKGEDDD